MISWILILSLFTTESAPEDDYVSEYTEEFIQRHSKKEFYTGCYWTLRQIGEICESHPHYDEGFRCRRSEVLAWDFQARLLDYYRPSRPGHQFSKPPIDEVFWLLSATESDQTETFAACPGLLVTSLLMMAEIRLQIDGPATGESYANKARVFIQELENSPDAIGNLRSMYSMFPVEEAWASYNSALEDLRARNQSAFEVDFVIAKCNHTLSWLRNITVSSHWRLHIIDKCGDNFPDDFTQQQIVDSLPFKDVIFTQLTTDQTDGLGLMTGECTAYLYYILARYEEVPDFVIFLHDDAPRHLQIPFLNIVTKSIFLGTFHADFLHLNHERYLQMRTDCLSRAHQRIFGDELKTDEFLSSYCCGQFVVSRKSIMKRSIDSYNNMNNIIRTGWNGTGCEIGNMPCYIAEFLWQKVFTGLSSLPLRASDNSLPLFLRYDHGRSTRLPSSLDFSLYHMSQSSWRGNLVGPPSPVDE